MNTKKVVGIIDEDPYDRLTWSGSSRYFFKALDDHGALCSAISASPPKTIQRLYQALSFQVGMQEWKFKYHLNTAYYHQMTLAAQRALDRIDYDSYDVIVQIGAWYDLTGYDKEKRVVSYHDGNLAALLASPYGYPKISQAFIKKTLAYERELYNRMHLIFPMSKWLAGSFMRDFGVGAGKIYPVGAGVNLPRVLDVSDKLYDEPNILFVGKDFKRKGGFDLLRAFEIVRKEIPRAELTIIGPSIESPPKGVRCLGFIAKNDADGVERLLQEYKRASVFVLPSLYEPFGIVFAEAMAHRLPCIGSNICAMPEIIEHGKTGFVVPPQDPDALANKILLLLKEPDRCREFGDEGFLKYKENYTWQAVTDRMCKIINSEL